MNTSLCFVLALCAPPLAQEGAGSTDSITPAPVASGALSKASHFDLLIALSQPPDGLGAGSAAGGAAAIYPAMHALAEVGDGRALAWCARHIEVAGSAAAGEIFTELVREHASALWIEDASLDPLAAVARANGPARSEIEAALTTAVFTTQESTQLALLLRAAALAPSLPESDTERERALALIDRLRSLWPDGRFADRAEALAWRIENLAPGATAPQLCTFDVDGNEVVLSDWIGQDVLIDVWRDDDPDLTAHLERLRRLVARVDELRPDRRLQVIGVGLAAKASEFRLDLEELDLGWVTSFERDFSGHAGSAWRLDGLPSTSWVGSSGSLRATGLTLEELERQLLAPDPGQSRELRSLPGEPLPRVPAVRETETTDQR